MALVEGVEAQARTVATDAPESDGTLAWQDTTIVIVLVHAGGRTGVGYTYADASAAALVESKLAPAIVGSEATDVPARWQAMHAALRNAGQAGAGAMALSAVDLALHDLRGKLLGLPVHRLLGRAREAVPIYASGGFCSWPLERLQDWCAQSAASTGRVKIKVGRHPEDDRDRLRAAREGAGDADLMVDANGAYRSVAEAGQWARAFADAGVHWLEEPLSSDDLDGLRAVRERAPAGITVAAGEYIWSPFDARRMLEAGAVDVLQVDVTRCGGITGALMTDALAFAHGVPTSLHCAPAASAHTGATMRTLLHLEHFHDHVRIEDQVFDGAPRPDGSVLVPPDRPGLGLEVR